MPIYSIFYLLKGDYPTIYPSFHFIFHLILHYWALYPYIMQPSFWRCYLGFGLLVFTICDLQELNSLAVASVRCPRQCSHTVHIRLVLAAFWRKYPNWSRFLVASVISEGWGETTVQISTYPSPCRPWPPAALE